MAQQIVAAITVISKADRAASGFTPGQLYTLMPDFHGPLQEAKVIVLRKEGGTRVAIGAVGMKLAVGDVIRTAPDSGCSLFFTIGGYVAIGKNAAVQIVGERNVKNIHIPWERAPLQFLDLWLRRQDLREQRRGPRQIAPGVNAGGIQG